MMLTTNTSTAAGVASVSTGSAPPLPTTPSGRIDTEALGVEIAALVDTDPQAAGERWEQAAAALTPVQQGELLRSMPVTAGFGDWSLPGVPDFPIPGLPKLPSLPDIPNPIDWADRKLDQLRDAADAIGDRLRSLPHAAADRLADSMRGDKARVLTSAERNAIREAFGDRVDLDKVRIVDGPGRSPAAHAAFKVGGNPAITIGNTIYLERAEYSANLSNSRDDRELLLHEFTHVIQYKEMGYGTFGSKYASDLKEHGFDRDKVYHYETRDTTYAEETIEGQAQMVGEYARVRGSALAENQSTIRDLERRLADTSIYGF